MRLTVLSVVLMVATACGRTPVSDTRAPDAQAVPAPSSAGPSTSASTAASSVVFPLRVNGAGFVDAEGKPFEWRGVTAFRLAEMISAGREADVAKYLDWAASQKLNVVRVLLMAQHLFSLSPDAGRAALPRLLDLAKERGIAAEVVAFADTRGVELDYEAHLREIGRIALERGNAFVEIANEPGHATQDSRLHDPGFVRRLADLLPNELIVALGSAEYDEAYAGGDYATFHFPREREWGHVLATSQGAAMVNRWKKPLINDEPIGAAAEYRAGRRDNSPERFGAAAALTKFSGMGATFHYEGGLQARLPDAREAACLDAWMKGLALVPDAATRGEFLDGNAVAGLARTDGARAAFARRQGDQATILLIDPAPAPSVKLSERWTEVRRSAAPGVLLIMIQQRQAP